MNKTSKVIITIITILISSVLSLTILTIEIIDAGKASHVSYRLSDDDMLYEQFIDLTIAIAKEQPTYPEINGETIYGEMFDHPTHAWCTEFILYCLMQAELKLETNYIKSIYPWRDSAYECGLFYQRKSRYFPANEYIPKKGDMIFFSVDDLGYPDHTGLVIDLINHYGLNFIVTIEGNIPHDPVPMIRTRRLLLDDPTIFGYGSSFSINENQAEIGY